MDISLLFGLLWYINVQIIASGGKRFSSWVTFRITNTYSFQICFFFLFFFFSFFKYVRDIFTCNARARFLITLFGAQTESDSLSVD